eukprot:Gb_28485 [translate_table: standard]
MASLILEFVANFTVDKATSRAFGYTISVKDIAKAIALPAHGLELVFSSGCCDKEAIVKIEGQSATLNFDVNSENGTRDYVTTLVMQNLSGICKTTRNVQSYLDVIDRIVSGKKINWPTFICKKMAHVFPKLQKGEQLCVPYAYVIAMLLQDQIRNLTTIEKSVQDKKLQLVNNSNDNNNGCRDEAQEPLENDDLLVHEKNVILSDQTLNLAQQCGGPQISEGFSVEHNSAEESSKQNDVPTKTFKGQMTNLQPQYPLQEYQAGSGSQKRTSGMPLREYLLAKRSRTLVPENPCQEMSITEGEKASVGQVDASAKAEAKGLGDEKNKLLEELQKMKQYVGQQEGKDHQLKAMKEERNRLLKELQDFQQKLEKRENATKNSMEFRNEELTEEGLEVPEMESKSTRQTNLCQQRSVNHSSLKGSLRRLKQHIEVTEEQRVEGLMHKRSKQLPSAERENARLTSDNGCSKSELMLEGVASLRTVIQKAGCASEPSSTSNSQSGQLVSRLDLQRPTLQSDTGKLKKVVVQQLVGPGSGDLCSVESVSDQLEKQASVHGQKSITTLDTFCCNGLRGKERVTVNAEAFNCPICMEPWTEDGEHRLCSLACGHLFGRSCIRSWLQQSRGKKSAQDLKAVLNIFTKSCYSLTNIHERA